jgi:hypothetical protein
MVSIDDVAKNALGSRLIIEGWLGKILAACVISVIGWTLLELHNTSKLIDSTKSANVVQFAALSESLKLVRTDLTDVRGRMDDRYTSKDAEADQRFLIAQFETIHQMIAATSRRLDKVERTLESMRRGPLMRRRLDQ